MADMTGTFHIGTVLVEVVFYNTYLWLCSAGIPVVKPDFQYSLQLTPTANYSQLRHHKASRPFVHGHGCRVDAHGRDGTAADSQTGVEEVSRQMKPEVGLGLLVVEGTEAKEAYDLETVEAGTLGKLWRLGSKEETLYREMVTKNEVKLRCFIYRYLFPPSPQKIISPPPPNTPIFTPHILFCLNFCPFLFYPFNLFFPLSFLFIIFFPICSLFLVPLRTFFFQMISVDNCCPPKGGRHDSI